MHTHTHTHTGVWMLKHVCLRTKHTNDPRMSGRPIRQRWHSARLVSRTHTHTHTHTHTRMQFWKRDSPSPSKNIKRFHHSRARLSLSLSLSLSLRHAHNHSPHLSQSPYLSALFCWRVSETGPSRAHLFTWLSQRGEEKKKKSSHLTFMCPTRMHRRLPTPPLAYLWSHWGR